MNRVWKGEQMVTRGRLQRGVPYTTKEERGQSAGKRGDRAWTPTRIEEDPTKRAVEYCILCKYTWRIKNTHSPHCSPIITFSILHAKNLGFANI
jgi:hypothetical protein